MECQTETATRGAQGSAGARPLSATSKKSYFDKLSLNMTSRQAGSDATGEEELMIRGRGRF